MGPRNYQQSLKYLYSLQKFGMIFGLTQVEKILGAVGRPHEEVRCIHVGGTNGKGSTAAMTASILRREGYRVGLYTSPHLVRFTERIQVNGKEIAEEEVAELAQEMRKKIKAARVEGQFTFFDFTTAMALLYFSRRMVDLAVMEVGLGGRLDSTNVVDPLISIVTNVAKEHEEHLGNTILKIAGEKAGIIKEGRPFVTAAAQPAVLRLFSKICREKGAPLFCAGRDFRFVRTGEKIFQYEGLERKLWDVRVNLGGPHQIVNAATALCAAEILDGSGYPVSIDAMIHGLNEVEWPGRLEMVRTSPRVVLDGAHNPAGAQVLKEALSQEFRYRRLILLLGIMKDKDIPSILRILAPLADRIILTRPGNDRAADPDLLRRLLGRHQKKAEVIPDLKKAIESGLSITGEEDLLCMTGSLYTTGEARAYLLR